MAVNDTRWGVLYCPKSSLYPNRRREKVENCLRENHIDYDFVQSESMGSVERLVKMLINNGYKTIVIVGGDSALNDAVNCLMQLEQKVRNEISLGVIPNGIMNDFARFWGIKEGEIDENVKWLKLHRVRKIDLGRINYKNKKGEAGTSPYLFTKYYPRGVRGSLPPGRRSPPLDRRSPPEERSPP